MGGACDRSLVSVTTKRPLACPTDGSATVTLQVASLAQAVTVAILAQGTSWAVAVTQAFLSMGSSPGMDPYADAYAKNARQLPFPLTAIPRRMHRISSDLRS